MQRNIGTIDRYVRFVGGLVMLSAGSQLPRRLVGTKNTLTFLGAMKVAEGVMGWCPLVQLMGSKNTNKNLNASASSKQSNAGIKPAMGMGSGFDSGSNEFSSQPDNKSKDTTNPINYGVEPLN